MTPRATAGVVLIGNELLSGRVRDENLGFLARELWSLGVSLRRAAVVRDEVEEIARAVAEIAAECTFVFTSGGVGPTHDDQTIEGVARAFGAPVDVDPELEMLLREHFGDRLDEFHLRMARVPRGAELVGRGPGAWPTVRFENVFVFPGVPAFLRRRFARLVDQFRQSPFYRRTLELAVEETAIAPILDRLAAAYADVEIGSYPAGDRVLVTFEGGDAARVGAAFDEADLATRDMPRPV